MQQELFENLAEARGLAELRRRYMKELGMADVQVLAIRRRVRRDIGSEASYKARDLAGAWHGDRLRGEGRRPL